MEIEIWEDINGFEGLYQVSNFGQVKSYDMMVLRTDTGKEYFKPGRILSKPNKNWYHRVNLAKNGKLHPRYVHRLVAEMFIPNPNNYPEVNHIDGDKKNSHFQNLEWVTGSQNCTHAYNTGLTKCPKDYFEQKHKVSFSTVGVSPVSMLDNNGVVIKSFESIKSALLFLGKNEKDGSISASIKENYKAYGYSWKYD